MSSSSGDSGGRKGAASKRATNSNYGAKQGASTSSSGGNTSNSSSSNSKKEAAEGGSGNSGSGQEQEGFSNSFSVDIDLFSEECDLNVNNYRQAIHEEVRLREVQGDLVGHVVLTLPFCLSPFPNPPPPARFPVDLPQPLGPGRDLPLPADPEVGPAQRGQRTTRAEDVRQLGERERRNRATRQLCVVWQSSEFSLAL